MEKKKYVITADGRVKLGNENNIHAYMACGCPESDCGGRAIAAGYYEVVDGKVQVYGESSTLIIKSKTEDATLIEKHLSSL